MSDVEFDGVLAAAEAAAAGEEVAPVPVVLRDGRTVLLRPIGPEDKEGIQQGLGELSTYSRYLAFHEPRNRLTDDQLRYVTEVDHHDHVAWVATDPDARDGTGLGIGCYVRLEDDRQIAEAAITVLDRAQGQGLGTLLLAVLAHVARANDVHVFRNYVLAENETMLGLFDELGARRRRISPRVYEVDFALPDDPEELPDTPAGRAVRAFARNLGEGPRLAFFPGVWFRRPRRADRPPPTVPGGGGWRERGPLSDWIDDALTEFEGTGESAATDASEATDGSDEPPSLEKP